MGTRPARVRTRRLVGSAAAGLAGIVVLTACGASDQDQSTGTGGSGAPSTSYSSPLGDFLNPESASGADAGQAASMAKEKKVQELAAACMADEGFDYEPFVYPMGPSVSPTGDLAWDSREFAEKYGYGISTVDFSVSSSAESTVVDPNQAMVDAMSDGEREAYYAALYGGGMGVISAEASTSAAATSEASSTTAVSTDSAAAPTTAESAAPETTEAPVSVPEQSVDAGASVISMADQGCMGQAQAEVYGDPTEQQNQFQSLFDAMSRLQSDVENDPAVKEALAAWIGCMADAGHAGYTEIYAANNEVNQKWGDLNGWNQPAPDSAGTEPPPTPAPDKVAEFKTYEIQLATSDFDCKESSGYTTTAAETRIAAEEKFVEDHRAELEQYRDSMNGGG